METNHNELICELRDQADVLGPGTECDMLRRAADVIEQQDEEIAIMATEHTAEKNYCPKRGKRMGKWDDD